MSSPILKKVSAQHYQIITDISFKTATTLLLEVNKIIKEQTLLTLDLATAGRCSSVAVALLLQIKTEACKKKIKVNFLNIPIEVLDLAKLSNVDRLL